MTVFRSVCLFVCAIVLFSGVAINAKPSSIPANVAQPGQTSPQKAAPDAKTDAKPADTTPGIAVTSIDLVKQPDAYMDKKVTFKAVFNSFASLGLDYKKAFRDSKDYVTVLVLRPDVNPKYRIPLSELKLFFPRKKSDVVMHLDAGDTIQVTGKVFSTALGEPWVDIDQLTIIEKTAKAEGKTDPLKPEGHKPDAKPDSSKPVTPVTPSKP